MRRYRPLLDPAAPEKAADLDYRSVGDFTRLYFGPRVLAQWVAPMLAEATGGSADEASRVAFLLQLAKEQTSRFALLRSGLEEVARTASERLSMRYGFEVESIKPRRGGFDIACSRPAGSTESLRASAVILAVPPMSARRLAESCLSLSEQDALVPFRYAPGATLAVASSEVRTAVPQYVRVPASEGSPIQSYLVEPGEQAGRAPAGAGLVTLAAREDFLLSRGAVSDEVLAKDLLSALSAIAPEAVSAIRFSRLHRTSEAQPCMDVGTYRRLARFQKVQNPLRAEGRRLYFAGDYLSGPRINDAVASGQRAGRAVLEDVVVAG
jgi:oxygen-dependent protoporphyrinogen oxidase